MQKLKLQTTLKIRGLAKVTLFAILMNQVLTTAFSFFVLRSESRSGRDGINHSTFQLRHDDSAGHVDSDGRKTCLYAGLEAGLYQACERVESGFARRP